MTKLVLSPFHFAPSVAAALLAIILAFTKHGSAHKTLAYGLVFFGVSGVLGFILDDWTQLFGIGFHSIHGWLGLLTILTSFVTLFLKNSKFHCLIGKASGSLALISLVMGFVILFGLVPDGQALTSEPLQIPTSSMLPEVETLQFMNVTLTPIADQGNNAILGTQAIDRETYTLEVGGLVNKTLTWTYTELLNLPAFSEVAYMPCVEGWGFPAKWTGFRVTDLLNEAGVTEESSYIVFVCKDGYSTGLPLTYLRDKNILLAYGLNDVTLPMDRGFPLQLVAESKYGYKWAKWIVKIEVVAEEYRGYWESRGYSNSADVGTFPYG